MARTLLSAQLVQPQSSSNLAALNLTTLAAAGVAPAGTGAGNGVQFTNYPGQTTLLVSTSGTATTPTIVIGSTLYGQAATGIVMTALATTALSLLGPFYSVEQIPPGGPQIPGIIAIDFSSVTGVLCLVLQNVGVS
jgi:hypothetical protein